jgi:hypothetical protein
MNAATISEMDFRPAMLEEDQEHKIVHQHVLQGSAQGVLVFNTAQVGPWQVEAVKRILGFKKLSENWDSYGSKPPSEAAINKAIEFVLTVPSEKFQPRILPVSGGAVQLEWRKRGRGLQVEFLPDGTNEYLLIEDGNPIDDGKVLPYINALLVRSLLSWLTAK